MERKHWIAVLAGATMSLSAQAGTIYLCKAYGGGLFWAQAHCNQHKALIERIVSVPDGLAFDQQVAIGQQQRLAASTVTTNNTVSQTIVTQHEGINRQTECKALDAQIQQYDAMARQPQSGPTQDWISEQRKKARDRQFQIKC